MLHLFWTRLWVQKPQNIYLRDFKDVEFVFNNFANFKFPDFEIEVSFRLTLANLQNSQIHLQICVLGT